MNIQREHAQNMKFNRVEIRPGISLHYATCGEGPETVVMVHGLAINHRSWYDLAPLFPPERFRLYLVDLQGSGGSDKPLEDRYSLEAHAEAIAAFLQRMGLREVTLMGHSMGGAIALVTAIREQERPEPARVKRLVLIGAPAYPQRFPKFLRLLRLPLLPWVLLGLTPGKMIAKRGLLNAYHDPALADEAHVDRYAGGYRGFRNIWCLIRTVQTLVPEDCESLTKCYPKLQIPTLLIWGEHDRVVPVWQGKRLREEIPEARLEVLPECGHNPQEELPTETWKLIEEFVAEK